MANSSTSRPGAPDGPGTQDPKSEAAGRMAREDISQAHEQMQEDIDDMARTARKDMDDMATAASDYAESQKAYAAEQIGGIAEAIGRAASELSAEGRGVAGRYARDLSSGLDRLSRSARSTNVDRLMDDVGRFGREHPVAFLGLAALSGFAISRFATASAERRRTSRSPTYTPSDTETWGGDMPAKASPVGESEHEEDQ